MKNIRTFESFINEDKFNDALFNMEDWMPDDPQLQDEYYEILGSGDVRELEDFFNTYADDDVLNLRYRVTQKDLKKLAQKAIGSSSRSSSAQGASKTTGEQTVENIEKILKEIGVKNYTINSDLTVDAKYVDIQKKFKVLPVKFGKVDAFFCDRVGLISLEGAPHTVRTFSCQSNSLTSLAGAPGVVEGDFNCSGNKLTSLSGSPQKVGGDFLCLKNSLTSLAGGPQVVGKDFVCSSNNLNSLKGGPKEVGGKYICGWQKLSSLDGAPRTIGGKFDASPGNLSSLKGGPETVGGDYLVHGNPLKSLEGAPKTVGGNFWLPTSFTAEEVEKVTKVGGKIDLIK